MAKDRRNLRTLPKVTSSIENDGRAFIENVSIKDEKITISPVNEFTEENENQIRTICQKHKNIYLSGYPHSRKTRKNFAKDGYRFEKVDNLRICLSYLLKKLNSGKIEITVLISDEEKVLDRFPEEKLMVILQNWQQDVVDNLLAAFS